MDNKHPLASTRLSNATDVTTEGRTKDKQRLPTGRRRFKTFIRDKLIKWRDRIPQDDNNCIPEVDNVIFTESDEGVRFPSSLSAAHRRIVHATALSLDLYHASAGDRDNRSVVVSRTGAFEALNVTPTATSNVWYNSAVTKQKLTARYFKLVDDEQYMAWMRTHTEALRAIIREPFVMDDFNDVSWMERVPDDLSELPLLDRKDCIIVDTLESLQDLANELNLTDEFAFDLEMHNYRSYYGLTCALQISANLQDYLVDTIKLWDHIPLLAPAFADRNKLKVGHAMEGGDVPALFRDFGIVIVNGVDTQEMAAVLGDKQIGLAALLAKYGCKIADEVRVNKSVMQVTDWRTRPFTDEMVVYACGDVHYLLPLHAIMKKNILTMSEKVEAGLGLIVDSLHTDAERAESVNNSTAADGATEHADIAASGQSENVGDHNDDNDHDDDFCDDVIEDLVEMDDAMNVEDEDEGENDDAMWEGWGVAAGADEPREGTMPISTSAEDYDRELTQNAPAHQIESPVSPIHRGLCGPREHDEPLVSHVSQPAYALRSNTASVVTPIGLDRYRRVCIKSARHCLKLWKPKAVSEDDYTQAKGFSSARKSKSWEEKHTLVFKRLFYWRERVAQDCDESPVYVLSAQMMLDISKRMPVSLKDLRKIQRPLSDLLAADDERYAKEIIEIVRVEACEDEKRRQYSMNANGPSWKWTAAVLTGVAIMTATCMVWLRAKRR